MLNKNRGRWTFNTAVGLITLKFEVNDLGFGAYNDLINAHFFLVTDGMSLQIFIRMQVFKQLHF